MSEFGEGCVGLVCGMVYEEGVVDGWVVVWLVFWVMSVGGGGLVVV